jgi:hypothetical protein
MSCLGYKDLHVLEGILVRAWHPILIGVTKWIVVRYSNDTLIITSAYREGDKGVHGTDPLRAFDLRSHYFEDPEAIAKDINLSWLYDPKRPKYKVALYHAKCPECGQNNMAPYHARCLGCDYIIKDCWHLHIQVHPRTIFLGNGDRYKK